MEVFTKRTGWVQVIKDLPSHQCLVIDVRGYTFYLAKYQEILAIDKSDEEIEDILSLFPPWQSTL